MCVGTEMAGQGPLKGGGAGFAILWPTDGAPFKRMLGRFGRVVRVGTAPKQAHGPIKATCGQARGPSLVCLGTEKAGQGPRGGGG